MQHDTTNKVYVANEGVLGHYVEVEPDQVIDLDEYLTKELAMAELTISFPLEFACVQSEES